MRSFQAKFALVNSFNRTKYLTSDVVRDAHPPTPNVNVGNAQNHGSEKKMLLLNIEIRGRGRGVSVGDVRSGSEVKYFVGSLYLKD